MKQIDDEEFFDDDVAKYEELRPHIDTVFNWLAVKYPHEFTVDNYAQFRKHYFDWIPWGDFWRSLDNLTEIANDYEIKNADNVTYLSFLKLLKSVEWPKKEWLEFILKDETYGIRGS